MPGPGINGPTKFWKSLTLSNRLAHGSLARKSSLARIFYLIFIGRIFKIRIFHNCTKIRTKIRNKGRTQILGTDQAKICHEKRLHGPNQKKVRPKNEDHHFIPAARITFNPDWAQKISKFQKNFHLQKIVFDHFFAKLDDLGFDMWIAGFKTFNLKHVISIILPEGYNYSCAIKTIKLNWKNNFYY